MSDYERPRDQDGGLGHRGICRRCCCRDRHLEIGSREGLVFDVEKWEDTMRRETVKRSRRQSQQQHHFNSPTTHLPLIYPQIDPAGCHPPRW